MAARIVHVPADAPAIAIYKSGILPRRGSMSLPLGGGGGGGARFRR